MSKSIITIDIDNFISKITRALEEKYGEYYTVSVREVVKNNSVVKHALTISTPNDQIVPNIYIDEMYAEYSEGRILSDIVDDIMRIHKSASLKSPIDVEFFEDYEKAKEHLGIKLINREYNEGLLEDVPSVEFLDLSIVFIVYIKDKEIGEGSVLIHEEHRELWGIDIQTLYNDALANMQLVRPVMMKPIFEVIGELLQEDAEDIGDCEEKHDDVQLNSKSGFETKMYVLTNEEKTFGAGVMCYDGILKLVANRMGGDYFIIPSSIHELIVLPISDDKNKDDIVEMIRDVNRTHIAPQEILSNNLYCYDSINEKVEIYTGKND